MFFSLASVTFSLLVSSYNYQTGQTVVHYRDDNLHVSTLKEFSDNVGYDDVGFLIDDVQSQGGGNVYVFDELSYQSIILDSDYTFSPNTYFSFLITMKSSVTIGAETRVVELPFVALSTEYDDGNYYYFTDTIEYEGVGQGYNYIPYYVEFNISSTNSPSSSSISDVSLINYQAFYSSACEYSFIDYKFDTSFHNIIHSVYSRLIGFQFMPVSFPDTLDDNISYQDGYTSGHDIGYTEGYDYGHQVGYADGYGDGERDGINNGHITEIFTNIASIGLLPVNVFLKIFNLEVYGVNIADIVTSLLTIGLVIIIFRVIFGGKASESNGN